MEIGKNIYVMKDRGTYWKYHLSHKALSADWAGPEEVKLGQRDWARLIADGENCLHDFVRFPVWARKRHDKEGNSIYVVTKESVMYFLSAMVKVFDVSDSDYGYPVVEHIDKDAGPKVYLKMVRRVYLQFADVLNRNGFHAKVITLNNPPELNGKKSTFRHWYMVYVMYDLNGERLECGIDFLNQYLQLSYASNYSFKHMIYTQYKDGKAGDFVRFRELQWYPIQQSEAEITDRAGDGSNDSGSASVSVSKMTIA